jgi:hypothetical protein
VKDNTSLVLKKEGRELFSSDKPGLRPLFECVQQFKGKEDHCTLYDKVVGLAAARLILYSGFITEVKTPLASEKAVQHIGERQMPMHVDKVVPNIMNKEQTSICPMEKEALELDDSQFYNHLKNLFME